MKRLINLFILTMFVTSMFATVTVSGRCVRMDDPETVIADVEIIMTSQHDSLTAYSGADGCFTVEGVSENTDYLLITAIYGFLPYETVITVEEDDIVWLDIMLVESLPQVIGLTAEIDGRNVNLSWSPPERELTGYEITRNGEVLATLDAGVTFYIDEDLYDGIFTYGVRTLYTEGTSLPVWVSVQMYPVDVYGFVNTATHPEGVDGAQVILESYPYYFEMFTIDGQFYFNDIPGVRVYDLTIAYCDDEFDYYSFESEINTYDYNDYDLGTITLVPISPWITDVIAIESDDHTEVYLSWSFNGNLPGFQYFQIWRLREEDHNYPENWHILEEVYSDTTYIDTDWQNLSSGTYLWGVRAAYINENYSIIAFSNTIERYMIAPVTIQVTTDSNECPQGAYVCLENIDGNENHRYEGAVPTSGALFFPTVYLGLYTLTVTLEGFDDYTEYNVIIEDLDGEEIDIELIETQDTDDTAGPRFTTALIGNSPNPFNPVTTIRYTLDSDRQVRFTLFDIMGRIVETIHEHGRQGVNTLVWNAEDLPSGIYFIRMDAGNTVQTRKATILK